MARPSKLTEHLLQLNVTGFTNATQHRWLRLIGQGRLSKDAQLQWLLQDRMYAMSYVPFIGSLLAKVHLSNTNKRTKTTQWAIADMLIGALVNIKRELEMFEVTLEQHYSWSRWDDVETRLVPATVAYQNLMAAATSPSSDLLAGLTLLWAMEKCYLEAWRFTKSQGPEDNASEGNGDVVRDVLIPNWTSPEFVAFVDDIGQLLDRWYSRSEATSESTKRCEDVWQQVLHCETQFWPKVGAEGQVEGTGTTGT